MSDPTDGNQDDKKIPDASDTIARLRDAAQRRAKQRQARSRADASAQAELDAVKSHAHTLEAKLAAQTEQLAEAERAAAERNRELEAQQAESIRALESQIAQLRSEHELVTSTLKSTEARNAELTKEVAAAQELRYRIDTLEAEADNLRAQVRDANAQIELAQRGQGEEQCDADHRGVDQPRTTFDERARRRRRGGRLHPRKLARARRAWQSHRA